MTETHRRIGSHLEQLIDGGSVVHVECSCGWDGEPHVWAEHIDAEYARLAAAPKEGDS